MFVSQGLGLGDRRQGQVIPIPDRTQKEVAVHVPPRAEVIEVLR